MTRSTNMEHVEVLRDLRDLARAAIDAGDWVVDGACDPDAVLRRADAAIASLSAPQPPAEAQPVAWRFWAPEILGVPYKEWTGWSTDEGLRKHAEDHGWAAEYA